jgi:hypothetical protein
MVAIILNVRIFEKRPRLNYSRKLLMIVNLVTCKVLKQLTCKYGISCHDGGYRGIEPLLFQQLVRYVLIGPELQKKMGPFFN